MPFRHSLSNHPPQMSSDPTLDGLTKLWTMNDRRRIARTRDRAPRKRATSIWEQIQSALSETAQSSSLSALPCTTYEEVHQC